MERSVFHSPRSSDHLQRERCLILLAGILEDVRAQVYSSNPQLATLVQIAGHLAGAGLMNPEELRDVLGEIRDFEARFLGGSERYTRLLREPRPDPSQLQWEW
jgi:hypothetical protein